MSEPIPVRPPRIRIERDNRAAFGPFSAYFESGLYVMGPVGADTEEHALENLLKAIRDEGLWYPR